MLAVEADVCLHEIAMPGRAYPGQPAEARADGLIESERQTSQEAKQPDHGEGPVGRTPGETVGKAWGK